MSKDQISISFTCKACNTTLSWPDDIKDSTEVHCSGCGASAGKYDDLKKVAVDAAKKKVDSAIKDMLKRFK